MSEPVAKPEPGGALLEVRDLVVSFPGRRRPFRAAPPPLRSRRNDFTRASSSE